MRISILDIGFDDITMDEALERAISMCVKREGCYVVTPNPEIVWECRKNSLLKQAVERADLVLADGVGVYYGAKLLGTPLKQKLPGIDFACALMKRLAALNGSVYLLGAKPGVAETAAVNLEARFPGLKICGVHDGYFTDDEPVVESICQASPDFLMVCTGSPRQELWMSANAARLNVGLIAGLGGCLDVFAGIAVRAPEFWQKAGLEWFYRLLREPSRIGRMSKLPLFALAVVGRKLGGVIKQ